MKVIVNISIRIFIIFTIFQFINSFSLTVNNFIGWNQFNKPSEVEIGIIEIIKLYLPFILLWIIYLGIIILLWVKSKKISEKIIGEIKIESMNITLSFQSALSIGIILIGIYLIISTVPTLFSYLSNWTINKTKFIDKDFVKEYTIRQFIEIIGIIIKIIFAYITIKYNGKIVSKIIKIDKIE